VGENESFVHILRTERTCACASKASPSFLYGPRANTCVTFEVAEGKEGKEDGVDDVVVDGDKIPLGVAWADLSFLPLFPSPSNLLSLGRERKRERERESHRRPLKKASWRSTVEGRNRTAAYGIERRRR